MKTTLLRIKPLLLKIGIAAALVQGGVLPLQASSYNWTGLTTGTWGDTTNWSGAATPTLSDDLTILGPNNTAGALTININAAAAANSIAFTDTAAVNLLNPNSGANQTLTLGAGGITVGTGAVTIGSSTANQNVLVALNASQAWNIGAGGLTIANTISGSGFGITKSGAGLLTLTGSNTFTGGVLIQSGTVSTNSGIGGAIANSVFGTGTVTLGDSATGLDAGIKIGDWGNAYANQIIVASGAGARSLTFTWNNSGQIPIFTGAMTLNNNLIINSTGASGVRLNGAIGGSGGLIVNNSGSGNSVRLGAANNFTGGITINRGVLEQNNGSALGSGTITLGDGSSSNSATLLGSVGATNANPIVVAAGGSGTYTIKSTTGSDYNFSGSIALNNALTLMPTNAGAMFMTGTVTGSSNITIDGATTNTKFVSFGANSSSTFTGNITVQNKGTLKMGIDNPFSVSTAVTLDATSFIDAGGKLMTFAGLNGAGGTVLNNGSGLTLGGGGSYSYGGVISGNSVVKSGVGTQTLTGTNTYTGATTISAGTLQLGNGGATGALSVSSAITDNANLTINRNNAVAQGTDFSSAAITGTGSVTLAGSGTVTLGAANTYSGNTNINAGALVLSSNNAVQNSTVAIGVANGVIFNSGTTYNFGGLSGSANQALLDVTGTGIVLYVGANNASTTYSGILSGASNSALVKNGSGMLTLSGSNTFGGGITLNGGTLQAGNAAGFGTGAITTGAAGATLDLNGQSIANALTISKGFTLANSSASAAALTTDVNLTNDFTLNTTGSMTATRFIGLFAPRTITKTGNGTITTNGSSHNNLINWNIQAGTVVFANTSGYGADRGVTINGGTLRLAGANNDLINNGQAFTINSGNFDLNGKSETIAALSGSSAGVVQNTLASTTSTLTIGSGDGNATYAGALQDGAGVLALTKTGTGTQVLSGSSNYSGVTNVSGGTLQLGHAYALGATGTNSGTVVASGATLDLNGQTIAESLSVSGTLVNSNTTTAAAVNADQLNSPFFTVAGAGDIALQRVQSSGGVISVAMNGSGNLTLGGNAINNLLSVTLNSGTVVLAKTNGGSSWAIDRSPTVNGGTLKLGAAGEQIQTDQGITMNGGSFDLNGFNQSINSLVGNGGVVTNNGASAATLTIGANQFGSTQTSGTFAGVLQDGSASLGLSKSGTSRIVLAGNSAYTGATAVNGGSLVVSGSLAGTTSVSVSSGATLQVDGGINNAANIAVSGLLQGKGAVGTVSVNDGGTLTPGDSASILTVNNGLSFSGSGATLSIVLGKTSATGAAQPVAGTDYGQINVAGGSAITLNNATLTLSGVADNIQAGDRFFLIINGTGSSINGTFNGLADGAQFTAFDGAVTFQISYLGNATADTFTGGNDAVLSVVAVPEPSTWAMLVGGVGMLSMLRRGRRRF